MQDYIQKKLFFCSSSQKSMLEELEMLDSSTQLTANTFCSLTQMIGCTITQCLVEYMTRSSSLKKM